MILAAQRRRGIEVSRDFNRLNPSQNRFLPSPISYPAFIVAEQRRALAKTAAEKSTRGPISRCTTRVEHSYVLSVAVVVDNS